MPSNNNDDAPEQNDWSAPQKDEQTEAPDEFVGLTKEQLRRNREDRMSRARDMEHDMILAQAKSRRGGSYQLGDPQNTGDILGNTHPRVFFIIVVVGIFVAIVASQNPQWFEGLPSGTEQSTPVEATVPAQDSTPDQEPAGPGQGPDQPAPP